MVTLKDSLEAIYAEARVEAKMAIIADLQSSGFEDVVFKDANPGSGSIDFKYSCIDLRYKGRAFHIELSHTGYSFAVPELPGLSLGGSTLAKKLDKFLKG